MQAKTQASPESSSLASDRTHVQTRTTRPQTPPLLYRLIRFQTRFCTNWRRAYASIRSCGRHIRSQFSKEPLDQGPVVSWDQSAQRCLARPESLARSLYTRSVEATLLPWADTVDLRIFLMGFDAGEQWGAQLDSECRKHLQTPAWLLSVQEKFGFIPEKVNQEIEAFNDQISGVTPAAIAGVTRKD
jgi:hypothetical protein